MTESSTHIPSEHVEQAIYLIHGQKVMLDCDLASLYDVETRVLNQAVKRNIERFPDDFMFELTRDEIRNISQIVICSSIKHAPKVFAFTEQGVAMLAGVLKSPRAVEVNITIMRTFVKMRKMLESSEELSRKIAELEAKYDDQFRLIFEAIRELMLPQEASDHTIGFHVKEERAVYPVRTVLEKEAL